MKRLIFLDNQICDSVRLSDEFDTKEGTDSES